MDDGWFEFHLDFLSKRKIRYCFFILYFFIIIFLEFDTNKNQTVNFSLKKKFQSISPTLKSRKKTNKDKKKRNHQPARQENSNGKFN